MSGPMLSIETAAAVLAALYADWETRGGPSPSTEDEARVIATALRVSPISDRASLDEIWEVAQSGADTDEIAAAHIAAIYRRDAS